jgi:excisionase family DNA binding protein
VTNLEEGLRGLLAELVREEVRRQLVEATKPHEYLSAQEAGKVAGVARGTIRRWIREGRLLEHRAGRGVRVRRADLERLMREGRRKYDGNLSPEELARRNFAP